MVIDGLKCPGPLRETAPPIASAVTVADPKGSVGWMAAIVGFGR
jgi:hypothetical protein